MKWDGFLLIAGFLLVLLPGCSGKSDDDEVVPEEYSVKYEASSDIMVKAVTITYLDKHGETVTIDEDDVVDDRWTYSFSPSKGTPLYLSVKVKDGRGLVRATILVNNREHTITSCCDPGVTATVSETMP